MKRNFFVYFCLSLVCALGFAQSSKTVLDDFNPVLGDEIVLGETGCGYAIGSAQNYAKEMGYTSEQIVIGGGAWMFECPSFRFEGYGQPRIVISFKVKESEGMPRKWKEQGFFFSDSYNEWCENFEDLGFRKWEDKSPYSDDSEFEASVDFYAKDESVAFHLYFFDIGKRISVNSKNTLCFITASTVGTVYPGDKIAAKKKEESRKTESASSSNPSYTPCLTCGGTGQVMMPAGITGPMWTTCVICGGSGKIYSSAPTYVPGYNPGTPVYVPVQQGSGTRSGSTNGGTVKQNNTASSHKGCPHCEFPGNDYQAGNGVCKMCGGSGKVYGGFSLDARECSSCRGDGKCHFCNGTGLR